MYGMINLAVRKMVVENHGEAAWTRICAGAKLTDDDFSSLQKYPDQMTYDLVAAASRELGVDADAILETFGEYWTSYAQETSFANLLRFGGRSMAEFVRNLDQMHAKIKFSLPDLQPPMFRVTEEDESGFRLHYHSDRPGLAPLVRGMLKGVARMYGTEIDIRLDKPRAGARDYDEFVVRYLRRAAAAE